MSSLRPVLLLAKEGRARTVSGMTYPVLAPDSSVATTRESTLQVFRHHLVPALVLAGTTFTWTTFHLWTSISATGQADPLVQAVYAVLILLMLLSLLVLPVVNLVRGLRAHSLWRWTWTFALTMLLVYVTSVAVSALLVVWIKTSWILLAA